MILVTLNVTYVNSGLGHLFRIRSINLVLEYRYIRMAYNLIFFIVLIIPIIFRRA